MKIRKYFFFYFIVITLGIIVFNFSEIRVLLKKNLPHSTKVFIKKIFFGMEKKFSSITSWNQVE